MATATYTLETGSSTLKELGRKVQAGIYKAAQFGVEEWGWLKDLKKYEVALSQREITHELDILEGTGANFIAEGGKETRPSSPTAVTATVTFNLLNKRFTISRTTEMILGRQGTRAYLESQFKYQGRKAVEAVRKRLGDGFYGFSTAILAKISSVSTDDLILKDMHGVSGLGSTSHNRRAVDQFVAGSGQNADYIAVLNPTGPALRTAGIVKITAKTRSTNTITCGASGITSPLANDYIVYANSLENTTLAGGTEYNLGMTGLLDGGTSTSVHSVSGSTYERWNAAVNNSSGGRFTGIKLINMRDEIQNQGGGTMDLVVWAQGVKRDVVSQLQAGLRFTDAYAMEMDGTPKAKGVEFVSSRRVPDGYVFGMDKSNSVTKLVLTPDVDMPGMEDGDKLQDDSGRVFSADFIIAMPWVNRANFALYSGLTQA